MDPITELKLPRRSDHPHPLTSPTLSATPAPTMTRPASSSCQGPELSPQDVSEAYSLIQSALHKTPILTSESINSLTTPHDRAHALSLFFKAEVFQKTGAFKFRGASHAIARLPDSVVGKGVVTHSSGNHSAALACAAKERGIKCHVVMVRRRDIRGGVNSSQPMQVS